MNETECERPEIFNYVVLIVSSDALMCEFWNIPHYTYHPPTAMGSYFVRPLPLSLDVMPPAHLLVVVLT